MLPTIPLTRPFHFSVDDVIDSLIEVTDQKIPLFQHPTFRMFKTLHDSYGLTVDLYLFFKKEIAGKTRSLKEVRDLRPELEAQGDFIRFGPHALDYSNPPHSQPLDEATESLELIYSEIDRFAGKHFRSKELRLHFYSETYELADFLSQNGVGVLFSTDRAVGSYRLPEKQTAELLQSGQTTYLGANFVRTHFRLEFLAEEQISDGELIKRYSNMRSLLGYVVCYTHECEFARPEVALLLEKSAEITTTW